MKGSDSWAREAVQQSRKTREAAALISAPRKLTGNAFIAQQSINVNKR